ncbi:hypothetical protein JL721_12717 [Aureococcus anophagefferens]|nr:hypothetical protein JL721_12717 [Aureococcus anophagefferens]
MDWLAGRSLRDELERRAAASAALRLWRYVALRRAASSALRDVAAAQGAMIFSPDCGFSADPHPGNVMLLEDGRIALIDYGCYLRFSADERRTLADLYVALERRDEPEIVATLTDMGFVSRHMNETLMLAFATQCFDVDVVDASPYAFLVELEQYDTVVQIPKSYMLVTRVSLLLRGLGARVGCGKLSMAKLWKGEAREAQRSLPTRSMVARRANTVANTAGLV